MGDEWGEIKRFPCFQCEKQFDTYAGLQGHIASSKDHYGRKKAMKWLQDNGYWKKNKYTSYFGSTRGEEDWGLQPW